ncbi:phage portal protein [Candidatus Saccharibacteria bacterium]|nr:phage portal protein [Candidatus Saccharibacteria bacterium]
MALTVDEKKDIINRIAGDQTRRREIGIAREYYYIDNPILRKGVLVDAEDMLRKADNRIADNAHQLITDEEVDYLFSYAPIIDIGSSEANIKLTETLGDKFLKTIRALDVEACNSGCAWLHWWLEKQDGKNAFKYASVPSDQVLPIIEDSLELNFKRLIRYYKTTRQEGIVKEAYLRVEVWDALKCEYFLLPGDTEYTSLGGSKDDGTLLHNLGRIPFIMCPNNNRHQGNLKKYQGFIDAYDIVLSGYVNDVMDIQQVIYILENYAGTDLGEFTKELKKYKTALVGNDGIDGSKGDLRTLTIDIPVDARNALLETLKKQMYIAGQALSRDVVSVGNASGETLKFFYRDLDLKVGDKEVEFSVSFKELTRIICEILSIPITKDIRITFTRNRISNDKETAEICKNSVGIIPQKLIWANHPFVDNVEECEKMWEEEHAETDIYADLNKTANAKAKKLNDDEVEEE